jgi:hypothetical protein
MNEMKKKNMKTVSNTGGKNIPDELVFLMEWFIRCKGSGKGRSDAATMRSHSSHHSRCIGSYLLKRKENKCSLIIDIIHISYI